jgi:hypothetical protein
MLLSAVSSCLYKHGVGLADFSLYQQGPRRFSAGPGLPITLGL